MTRTSTRTLLLTFLAHAYPPRRRQHRIPVLGAAFASTELCLTHVKWFPTVHVHQTYDRSQ